MNALLEKHVVEEAVLLAETIAAVESRKDPTAADEASYTLTKHAVVTTRQFHIMLT